VNVGRHSGVFGGDIAAVARCATLWDPGRQSQDHETGSSAGRISGGGDIGLAGLGADRWIERRG
jgi:hypothetical protein